MRLNDQTTISSEYFPAGSGFTTGVHVDAITANTSCYCDQITPPPPLPITIPPAFQPVNVPAFADTPTPCPFVVVDLSALSGLFVNNPAFNITFTQGSLVYTYTSGSEFLIALPPGIYQVVFGSLPVTVVDLVCGPSPICISDLASEICLTFNDLSAHASSIIFYTSTNVEILEVDNVVGSICVEIIKGDDYSIVISFTNGQQMVLNNVDATHDLEIPITATKRSLLGKRSYTHSVTFRN